MATNFREVRIEIYLSGEFYCGDSCWVPDEEGVELEFQITDAIYDLIGTDQSAKIHLELQAETDDEISVSYCAVEGNVVKVVSDTTNTTSVCECGKKEKQLETDIKNIVSELVCEGLTDPARPSTEGMDASFEAPENRPTESTNGWMNTIGTFFKRLFWSEPETEPEESSVPGEQPLGQEVDDDDAILVSEDLQMDASPETPEENPKKKKVKKKKNKSCAFFIKLFGKDPTVPESEGQEVDIDDAISDLKTPTLVSEDLAESAGPSTEVSGSSSGMDASPETHENSPEESTNGWMMNIIGAFFKMFFWRDPAVSEPVCIPDASTREQTSETDLVPSVPEMEPEFDQADPEESNVQVPSVPEMEPEFDQADPEESNVQVPIVPEMEPEFDRADPEESCIPVPSIPEIEPDLDLADPEQLCVPVPSGVPEPELDLVDSDESCVPGPSSAVQKPNARTSKRDPFPEEDCFQLYRRVKACTKRYKPVTQVWNNIFIGNEETARDRMRLKELGITHILNAAAMKKKLRILLGIRWEKDIKDTVDTGASYYRGTKIRYCGLPTTKTSDISKYFMPAAKFIHKATKNSENKVFIHCTDGVNYAPTLFLAYLMIHLNMTVEDAIDYLVTVKYIKPDIDSLRQLAILTKKLVDK